MLIRMSWITIDSGLNLIITYHEPRPIPEPRWLHGNHSGMPNRYLYTFTSIYKVPVSNYKLSTIICKSRGVGSETRNSYDYFQWYDGSAVTSPTFKKFTLTSIVTRMEQFQRIRSEFYGEGRQLQKLNMVKGGCLLETDNLWYNCSDFLKLNLNFVFASL